MSASNTAPGTAYGTETTKTVFDDKFGRDIDYEPICPETEFCGAYFDCF